MSLWQQYLEMKKDRHFYPLDGAKALGVSELALMLDNPNTTYLGEKIERLRKIVLRLKDLGLVECIVRNPNAVHEKIGVYENVTLTNTMGLALNVGELDLRIFASKWRYAIAVKDETRNPVSYSIQFYDEFGCAIQKIFLRDLEKVAAYQAIVDEFMVNDKPSQFPTKPAKQRKDRRLSADELDGFHQRWAELKDIHNFGDILETYNIDRISAYEQAPTGCSCGLPSCAMKVDNKTFEKAFQLAHDAGIEIMLFVGNYGIVQIQTGKIHHIVNMHGWLNIMDKKEENFCLHLNQSNLAQVWVVRRPTRDGFISSIEGFDETGETVLIMFGRRQEGEPEQSKWTEITQQIADSVKQCGCGCGCSE
ncbi:MAG: hemin-degrading factor [Neisseriaceae bacterium]|nr:hemin-degrading factor [Neisseriaceae bacterium]